MSVFVTDFNTEADSILIDIVRDYFYIYTKSFKYFKNKNVHKESWLEIAFILNCSDM